MNDKLIPVEEHGVGKGKLVNKNHIRFTKNLFETRRYRMQATAQNSRQSFAKIMLGHSSFLTNDQKPLRTKGFLFSDNFFFSFQCFVVWRKFFYVVAWGRLRDLKQPQQFNLSSSLQVECRALTSK
jgi:hypothetical protein